MTAYNFFLKKCYEDNSSLSIVRSNILKWNRERVRMEWAIRNLKKGDSVLLFNKVYNPVEAILIAKIIGPNGKLTVVGE